MFCLKQFLCKRFETGAPIPTFAVPLPSWAVLHLDHLLALQKGAYVCFSDVWSTHSTSKSDITTTRYKDLELYSANGLNYRFLLICKTQVASQSPVGRINTWRMWLFECQIQAWIWVLHDSCWTRCDWLIIRTAHEHARSHANNSLQYLSVLFFLQNKEGGLLTQRRLQHWINGLI